MELIFVGIALVIVAMVYQAMINSLFKSQTQKYVQGEEEHRIESLEALAEKIKSIGNMGIQNAIVEAGILKVVCNGKKFEITDVDGIAIVEYNADQWIAISTIGRLINILKMIACTKKAAMINAILDQALEIQDKSSKKASGKATFRTTAFLISLLLGIVLIIVGAFLFGAKHDEQFYNIIKNNIYKDNVSYGTIFEKSLENAEWSTFDGEDGGNDRAIVEINATVASTKEKIVIQFASGLGMKRSSNPTKFELYAIEVNGKAVNVEDEMEVLYSACGDLTGATTSENTSEESDDVKAEDFGACYMGLADENTTGAYLGFSKDSKRAILILLNSETKENVFVVGYVKTEGDVFTLTDKNTGKTLSFTVSEKDGAYLLELSTGGSVLLGECTAEEFVDVVNNIDKYTTNVNEE